MPWAKAIKSQKKLGNRLFFGASRRHMGLLTLYHWYSHKCIFPNIFSYSFFFFFTTTEGFLPTSIINSGACCSLALSIEVLFSTYCIFRERNVTAFLVMKLLPFDIIRLRKHSAGCLGDICKYYNNGRIGELPLCFFVFFSKQFRTQPRWFFVFSGERNLFFTLAKRWMINFGIKSWLLKIWSYSFEGLCFS